LATSRVHVSARRSAVRRTPAAIQRGKLAAAELGQRPRPLALVPLDDLFADLERDFARSEREPF
jgi:hypothetical protein